LGGRLDTQCYFRNDWFVFLYRRRIARSGIPMNPRIPGQRPLRPLPGKEKISLSRGRAKAAGLVNVWNTAGVCELCADHIFCAQPHADHG
jgi:hypothetical protein